MSKQLHAEICKELNELYTKKNNDYGDSFAKLRAELPDAILVRIYDKYSRLKSLLRGTEQKVFDESISDTLQDLANYCIMELVERRKEADEQEPTKEYKPKEGECAKTTCGGHIECMNCIRMKPLNIIADKLDDIEYIDKEGNITKLGLG